MQNPREKRASEGNTLYVQGARIEVTVKPYDALPFGEHKDQHYIEIQALSWEGPTKSTLTARLNAEDLQRLFDVAIAARMIDVPVNPRVAKLVEQLHNEVMAQEQPCGRPQA